MLTIFIENLVLEGIHGATAKELERKQPFRVDIVAKIQSTEGLDDISATADYRSMKQAAEQVIREERHVLLETIATKIAVMIRRDTKVRLVKVTVRKTAIWVSGVPGVTVEI